MNETVYITARANDAYGPITQAQGVNCSITLSNYKHDAYTVLLVLKSDYTRIVL